MQLLYLFFFKDSGQRFPANTSVSQSQVFFQNSFIVEEQGGAFYFKSGRGDGNADAGDNGENTNESINENILSYCAEYFSNIEFSFEAEGVAAFLDNESGSKSEDDKIRLVANFDCLREKGSPIFYRSFCEGGVPSEYDLQEYTNGVDFKMENDPGFFPRSWYLKQVTLKGREVQETYLVPKEMYSILNISCD